MLYSSCQRTIANRHYLLTCTLNQQSAAVVGGHSIKCPTHRQAGTLAENGIWASSRISYLYKMVLSSSDIKTIKDYFQDKPVLKAFLFGSYARTDASEDSDVDILVELDYSKHIGMGFLNMKFDLEEKLHKTIDLVSSNAVSKHILPFINNEKKLIYER